jgi:TnpA family transposase
MCLFKCCEKQIQRLKEEKYQMDVEKAYSNNIYREMTIDDLRREYEKTATEAADYKALLESGNIRKESKAVEYMLRKYDRKTMIIKEMLNKWLKQAYVNEVIDI